MEVCITVQVNLVFCAAQHCLWKVTELKTAMVFYGRPASLIAQLPMINESFQPGMQQCAAEFFLDFTRALDITSLDYCDKGIVPSHCDTSFLNSFQFSLRSEVKWKQLSSPSRSCA